MANASNRGRSAYWTTIVLYGSALAALVVFLKYVEYRFWIRDLSMEVYIAVVAVLFTALGVWVGSKLLQRGKAEVVAAPEVFAAAEAVTNGEAARALGISARELEVLQLIAQGFSNQEIADKLFVSLPTVKSHSSSLFAKLEVSRRTQAVVKARAAGVIP